MNESNKINRIYDKIEIESMNVIFGKNVGNNWFTRDELSFANNLDLYDPDILSQAKNDWYNNFID